ncbi:MAG TPA: hypothetical protein VMU40_07730 [Steroidobacteraceae bacterium]|nr:hypothetical protein [Steroidobacteraceae bacterium]
MSTWEESTLEAKVEYLKQIIDVSVYHRLRGLDERITELATAFQQMQAPTFTLDLRGLTLQEKVKELEYRVRALEDRK